MKLPAFRPSSLSSSRQNRRRGGENDANGLVERVKALTGLMMELYGPKELKRRVVYLQAARLIRSERVEEQVWGLQKLLLGAKAASSPPRSEELPSLIDQLEEKVAETLARRVLERRIERKVARQLAERQEEHLRALKLELLSQEVGPDNPRTLRKFAELEKQKRVHLARHAWELLRPRSLDEIVGQQAGIRMLLSKLASPFPQHVLIYGPPGVGKTTAARLVLEVAKQLPFTPFGPNAPFVEVDGATLRWDPREVANPLLGSVHDPIYQGARRDLAEAAIPEPRPGLVTEAHGGILFIDEIGEMDPLLQAKLLKVLEEKRVTFESAYYDPDDPQVPKYIKQLFAEGAPADFILVGATTRNPEEINPALRSRCGEVFFEPLTPSQVAEVVRSAAARLGVRLDAGVPELISRYTGEGRKATQVLADAYGLTLYRQAADSEAGEREKGEKRALPRDVELTMATVEEILRLSRLTPNPAVVTDRPPEVGRVLALGVFGFIGSVIEVEAMAYPARERGGGRIRFNEAAGQMARDSLFNAVALARLACGLELDDWHIHVNVLGGGRIEGPSAGAAILLAVVSALLKLPVRQDLAVTGEVSLHGRIRAVGGIPAKLYGAARAGVKLVLVPEENRPDVPAELPEGLEVRYVAHLQDLWRCSFNQEPPAAVRALLGAERLSG
ncbi:MAG: ATP-dependent protease, Lon family [Limnochordales bacterium]|nr:ATP-dependent protease, Lon family [Limnochordales bacterium]